ncbi:MAG: carboxypeptidase regulatory-like domain-containing protein, partial [Lentimicrobiaceae bacterium]|nr:carboxypeptidase regulatory-like domain-containing protein [Lentimicrobiaceae bacterium]
TIWNVTVNWDNLQLFNFSFVPETSGEYVFGWRVITSMYASVYIDDFAVTTAGSVSGVVTDGVNPIAGARVELGGGSLVITDASGYYEFINVNTGVRSIKVSQAGYYSASENVTITTGNMTTKNFALTLRPTYNLPYFMSFEADEAYDDWWTVNIGQYDYQWKWSPVSGKDGPGCLSAPGKSIGTPDSWFFTPKLNLVEGYAYSVNFYAKNRSAIWDLYLNCYIGNEISVGAMTTELWSDIMAENYPQVGIWLNGNFIFNAPATGEYVLGFWLHYPYGSYPYESYFDDFSIINLGAVEGIVTDGENPLEGVKITVDETGDYAITNANGFYRINRLFADEYNLTASLVGWDEAYAPVTINAGATTTKDFELTPILYTYTVSGTVFGSGTGVGLEGATVTFSGYGTYSGTTDATGAYTLTGLYDNHTYDVTVSRAGYATYTTTYFLLTHVTDYNFTLNELILPVQRVTATPSNDDTQADVNWIVPETYPTSTFRHCSDIANWYIGFSNCSRYSVLGSVFRVDAEVTSITWVTSAAGGQHNFVNVFIFDLDEDGNPTNKVLYNVDNVPNVDNQWTTHNIPGSISARNGFMLAVSYNSGSFALLYDQATEEYPFVPNVNFYSANYETSPFQSWGGQTSLDQNNFMIYGAGFQFGKSVTFQHPKQEENPKEIMTYALYRLKENQPQASWTSLGEHTGTSYTDNAWNTLPSGVYQYAVQTKYSGNEWSIPKLSNTVPKSMEVNYTINITTNSGDPVTGAKVILTNNDGDPAHIYTGTAGSAGITFNNVWLGNYHIEILLDGFQNYTENNIIIDASGLSYPAQLIEIPYPVLYVHAEKAGENTLISWLPHSDLKIYRYDNGISTGQLGFPASSGSFPQGVMGSCHRENTTLYNMSWYLTDNVDPYPTTVNIYILNLDAQGMPTSQILYSALNVNSTKMEWNTYQFPTPVEAPNGFYLSLAHPDVFLSIGTTTPDEEYPFQPQTHFYCSDFHLYSFTALENNNPPYNVNFMIRAQGVVNGKAVQFPKSIENFSVYRLLQGQPEPEWTELSDAVTQTSYTDTEWGSLVSGTYQYAVKVKYTSNLTTEAKLSNVLVQVSDFDFRVNISSNGGISVAGAEVTLTHQDGNPDHVYTATSDATGVTFNNVFKGKYNLKITLAEHQEFTANNIEINASGLSYNAILEYLGIDDYAIENYMLYPNPAQSLLTVKRSNATKVTIAVYNNIGALLNTFETSESEFVIDVTNYSAGIFFIRLSDGTQTATKSFIKQ